MQTHLWTWNYTFVISSWESTEIKTKTISRSAFRSQILLNAKSNIVLSEIWQAIYTFWLALVWGLSVQCASMHLNSEAFRPVWWSIYWRKAFFWKILSKCSRSIYMESFLSCVTGKTFPWSSWCHVTRDQLRFDEFFKKTCQNMCHVTPGGTKSLQGPIFTCVTWHQEDHGKAFPAIRSH